MKSTKLLFHLRYLSSPSTQYLLYINSLQQRRLLHTCLPLMNKEKSSDRKDSNKSDGFQEQPHMRIEAKATTEEKRMSQHILHRYHL